MDPQFWHERWARGQTAFHEADGNALLLRHLGALGLPEDARLFLPLCGKTRDIGLLRDKGFRVVGAELSARAVTQLFQDLAIKPDIKPWTGGHRYAAPGIDIFVGDIFDLEPEALGPVDAIFDRAALVALPAPMRARYAAHIAGLSRGAPQLLITFAYDQQAMDGPPFSVPPEEVAAHYANTYRVVRLGGRMTKLRALDAVEETAWHLIPLNRLTAGEVSGQPWLP
ncbi:MAG: thiopurine S-methyltransferase [Pseudomonadota bacterium]